jgi:rod shape determining protein RodA
MMSIALPLYVLGVLLLIGVALFGDVSKRPALAQHRRGAHPAVRADEDRHAADARLVFPEREGMLRVRDFFIAAGCCCCRWG